MMPHRLPRRQIKTNSSEDALWRTGLQSKGPDVRPARQAQPLLLAEEEEGEVALVHGGFGFLQPKEGEPCFLTPQGAQGLLTGDVVRFVRKTDAAGRSFAHIQSFVRREAREWLGTAICTAHGYQFVPDEPMGATISLNNLRYVAAGQVLLVKTEAYKGPALPRKCIAATVEGVLGTRDQEGFQQDYALLRYQHQDCFSLAEKAEAERVATQSAVTEAWLAEGLQDLRDLPFVTIDGEGTRDLDDAIWAEAIVLPDGAQGWRVAVAISDVAHYVQEGGVLDKAAAVRGTSVYLPGRLIPMLPEVLSAGVCSLFPGVDRRAVVLTMDLTDAGEVVARRVDRAIIQSRAQLTYDLVASWMADPAGQVLGRADITEVLHAANAVFQRCLALRAEQGQLAFDEADPTLESQEDGTWVLNWSNRTEAHKLIEQLMLLANQQAAASLVARYGQGIFRHQPPPKPLAWQQLQEWAAAHGCALAEQPSMRALATLAVEMGQVIPPSVVAHRIRSAMRPAVYVAGHGDQGGHFSLSFETYTHFTSPIRRYADLLVHRLLLAPEGVVPPGLEQLAAKAAQCSDRARAAKLAERYVWDHYKREALLRDQDTTTKMVGQVFRASGNGLRVVLPKWQCTASIPAVELRKQGYKFDKAAWVRGESRLAVGALLPCYLDHVSHARPAYPEILLSLAEGGSDG